jgi:hypothetical protein
LSKFNKIMKQTQSEDKAINPKILLNEVAGGR